MHHRRHFFWVLLLIVSLAGLTYLLGNDRVTLFDRDEPRYAQTSRQMLHTGDWVVPRFLNTIRTAKPVLIYWCQASAMSVLGDNAFAARFPSAVAMLITVAIVALFVRQHFGARRGVWTGFILATSGLAIGSAKMCVTDAVLLLWITLSQLTLYLIWRKGVTLPRLLVLGVAIGLAGLTKGPVAPAVNVLTAVALFFLGKTVKKRTNEPFDPAQFPLVLPIVTLIVFLVCFPWLWAINWRAPEFLSTAIGHDVINRVKTGHEGHAWPPGFYLLTIWVTYFPWSILLPATGVYAWKHRHRPQIRFALAAIIGPWIMFELVAGKLWHYILPVFPFMAFLTANMLLSGACGRIPEFGQRLFRSSIIVWGMLVALAGMVLWIVDVKFVNRSLASDIAATLFAVAMLLYGTLVAWSFFRQRILRASAIMGVGMCAVITLFFVLWLPHASFLRLSQRLADVFENNSALGAPGMMIDYKEPSLAFHQGGGLIEQRQNNYLAITPVEQWPTWMTITRTEWDKLPTDVRARWTILGAETGLNYAGQAKMTEVLVLKRK